MSEDPRLAVHEMIHGFWKTQIIRTLAALSVADHLAETPATLETLVEKTGAHPDGLWRLLRAAVSIGMIRVEGADRFVATPMLDMLRADVPGSMRAMAIAVGSPGHWQPWGRFPDSVMTGEAQSKAALGRSHFEHYANNPEEAAVFIGFMQGLSGLVQGEVVRLVDTAGAKTVVDIGGANGALLCAFAKAHPDIRGTVFDLPHSHDSAIAHIAQQEIAERISSASGDFFESVPAADLYLLKFILHDWDDDVCIKILSNIRRAMKAGGRVVIIEMHLGEMGEPGFGPLVDLNMMTVTGGRERTSAEYETLLTAAGLKLISVTPTRSPFVIYEAVAR